MRSVPVKVVDFCRFISAILRMAVVSGCGLVNPVMRLAIVCVLGVPNLDNDITHNVRTKVTTKAENENSSQIHSKVKGVNGGVPILSGVISVIDLLGVSGHEEAENADVEAFDTAVSIMRGVAVFNDTAILIERDNDVMDGAPENSGGGNLPNRLIKPNEPLGNLLDGSEMVYLKGGGVAIFRKRLVIFVGVANRNHVVNRGERVTSRSTNDVETTT